MELIPLKCRNCTATLRVPRHVRFVTCEYCHSRLEIDHSRQRLRSRVLANLKSAARAVEVSARRVSGAASALHREARQLRQRNEVLHAEREISQLDDSWEQQRYAICKGRAWPPLLIIEIFWLLFRLGLQSAIITLAVQQTFDLPWWAYATPSAVILLLLIRSLLRIRRALTFRAARARYQKRRDVLQWRLRQISAGRHQL